ncbi:MAG: ABC transporter ATP-binding protein [Candidatus Korarchaeota archaeon]|nr:ABC transporter ATP-binding protein [Candidatus Korarchaeota archaeon]NIU83639.1 ATP-binding cassette domain-containing protein [Candidatus Thorarchaeota archaeon]NIW13866.1 ATP-binding cassette domain-containing protein [Candidatus Thorarchaeota archaeon]NIW51977.1 ATP-binding cassette domain-containing protein [Candidatus Korarchaeota archaeon]
MKPILEAKNLHVYYKTRLGNRKVLHGVNLSLAHGETLGLIGESGCGKTTLLKSFLRILPSNGLIPDGEIWYKERDLLKEKNITDIRRHAISMIFQDPTGALNPVYKIGRQLMDAIKSTSDKKKITAKEAEELAKDNLKKAGLPNTERILDSYPFQLSGGMKQRVCIALANATAKDVLLADEPTTNLDVTIQNQVLREIHRLIEETNLSVILVSQALGLVKNITDRVYVMYAGMIAESAEANELFADPLHPYTQGLLAAVPKLTGGGIPEGIPGRIANYLNPPRGCRFHPRCDRKMDICSKEQPPMIEMGDGHHVACHLFT